MARNALWSVLGTGTPLLAALVAIPLLIEGLGTARFGVLTLAWMVVGYFSLFDLGLGRALTKLVAEKIGADSEDSIPGVVWTAMLLMVGLGVVGGMIIFGLSPWLVGNVLKIPEELRSETLTAFRLLALSVPIVISSTGLRGILEAYQRFGLVNAIRLPLGMLTFLGPLAVLPFSSSLADIVLVLVCTRLIALLANLGVCLRSYPALRRGALLDRGLTIRLLSFGGWMTVSNIAAPLLLYAGRVFIIVMISAEAVAYFATPYEVVIRFLIVPGILATVLFPAFSSLFQRSTSELQSLYRNANLTMFVTMLPIAIVIFVFAKDGLALWINEEFSQQGFRVAQILAVGLFINSFGHISQALIQGYGRPDVTAKLHLAELLIYVPYLWWLIELHGIIGAALAWTLRVTISTVALFFLASRCLTGSMFLKHKFVS